MNMPKIRFTRKHYLVGVVAVLLAMILSALIFTLVVASQIKKQALEAKVHAQTAYDYLKKQDLAGAKTGLDTVNQDVDAISDSYAKLSFWQFTPLYWHYRDGIHLLKASEAGIDAALIMVDALEPYADVIGFKGQGSFVGGTAEDRIVKIMETLNVVAPTFDQIILKLQLIDQEISSINPKRYPFKLAGQSVNSLISTAKTATNQASTIMADYKPLLSLLPSIAGVESSKRYLVLFQNDAEIRPTGGFWTAYAVLKVEKGKVLPEKSDDIYDLDNQFKVNLKPPEMYAKLLNTKRWNLRDMNVSPDYKTSVETFLTYYTKLQGSVDGVIALNTQVLTDLVSVLGGEIKIEADGQNYGTFTTQIDKRCDCANIIYELEDMIGRPTPYLRSERKAVLGPLMKALLTKAYGAPKQQWPALFQAIWKNITQKDVLFYFTNPESQAAVERVNLGGRVKDTPADYFLLVDTNLGGAKTNMFINQEMTQTITLENQVVKKIVEITYKNPYKSSNCNLEAGQLCLNGVMKDWVRIYLPLGSKLADSAGFEADSVKTSEDLGKTVIEGLIVFPPESQKKISLTYTVPYAPVNNRYQLLIQKQSGIKKMPTTVSVNGNSQNNELVADWEFVNQF